MTDEGNIHSLTVTTSSLFVHAGETQRTLLGTPFPNGSASDSPAVCRDEGKTHQKTYLEEAARLAQQRLQEEQGQHHHAAGCQAPHQRLVKRYV